MKVKVSLDNKRFSSKPANPKEINTRILKIGSSQPTLKDLANSIGNNGQSFFPAVFKDKSSIKSSNVKEIQLIALDFDNKKDKKTITFSEAMKRCNELDIPVAFAYETLSSKNISKFRIVFTYFEPIVNEEFYKIIINILLEFFPEADTSTRNWNHLFYGGKKLLTEVSEKTIFPDRLFSSLYMYFSVSKNKKSKSILRFAKDNNIDTERNNFRTDFQEYEKVKNLESSIIYNTDISKFFLLMKVFL